MDWYVIAPFLLATLVLLMTPGPVMAIVGHNTLRHGVATGLLTVLGVELGEVCLLSAAFMGLTVSSELVPELFRWLALAGALYLAWLAVSALRHRHRPSRTRVGRGSPRPLVTGLTVAFGNPTAIVFYAAYFPQFIDPKHSISEQAWQLGAMYLATSLIFDLISVLAFASLSRFADLRRFAGIAELASAAVYVALAAITVVGFMNAWS